MNEYDNVYKLSWIINSKCNLKCIHCYPDSCEVESKTITDNDLLAIEDSLKTMRFKRVFLSGGEPLLDKNFDKYLCIAKKISDEVFVCTNGMLLTDNLIEELRNKGLTGIVISIQTINNECSEQFYGYKNIPNKIIESISKVLKLGFKLSVEVTIMQNNYRHIDDIIEKMISLGVKSISFKRLIHIGRGTTESISLLPSENYIALKTIFKNQLKHRNIKINVHDPLYGTIIYDYLNNNEEIEDMPNFLKSYSCRAGTQWIGIDPTGNVSPCPLLLYEGVIIGNIMQNNIKDIVSNSELIKKFINIEKEKNKKCKYHLACLGCKATSLAINKILFSKDPMCIHNGCICSKGDS